MAKKKKAWEGSSRWGEYKSLEDLSLAEQYRRLSQRADKRLQRLEKRFGQPGYEGLERWAYSAAMRDIKAWSGAKATRFGTKIPKFDNEAAMERYLRSKLNDIKKFLSADTSTVKGGIQSEGLDPLQKAAKTFSKEYGAKFTWQQLGAYYQSDTAKKISEQFGSKTVAKALGRFKRMLKKNKDLNREELINKIQNQKNYRLSSNKLTDQAMKRMLEEGFDPSMFRD